VVGRDGGDGLVKAHAIVVCADGHEGSEDLASALKAHVKERLAPHKYPRSFEWRTEPLPRNDRGKIARKLLK
jgi:acyl-coenzyme A synthetase/AMP-(fatty) acid ligase